MKTEDLNDEETQYRANEKLDGIGCFLLTALFIVTVILLLFGFGRISNKNIKQTQTCSYSQLIKKSWNQLLSN
jgi:hypothetical protein